MLLHFAAYINKMDGACPTPANNIVAAAMSTANLTLSPGSPKISSVPVKSEGSPQNHHVQMVGSPAANQTARSPSAKMPSTESMEITESHTTVTHSLIRQPSQDAGDSAVTQRTMESSPNMPTAKFEDAEKTVVLRTDGKDPHLVTVTPPPNSFPVPSVSPENRMQTYGYNSAATTEKGLMGTIPNPMSMQLLPKIEQSIDSEMRPKPKEDATYPITCGNNKGDLVWKRFICPGINAKCVKCGDNWYTPKEFVNLAGKSTLKDWKRAIRINGVMLRKMIENGELNYYDHENNCSNQCRSNKNSSFDGSSEKPYNSFESDPRESAREYPIEAVTTRSSSEDLAHLPTRRGPFNHIGTSNSLERSSSEDSGLAASPHLDSMIMREASISVDKIQDLHGFWNGILKMDLFDDIVRDVVTQITNLHSKTKHTGAMSIEDVATMTNLVNSLEMIPGIRHKVSAHKHKVDKETEESTHAIHELEKQLAEQRKYEQELKRKSQHLDSVMSMTPNEKRQRIIRIVRQKAVESRGPPGSTSSPVQGAIRPDLMGAVAAAAGRPGNIWPQIQVDGMARAASSQLARMNVSGSTAQAALPSMAPFLFTHGMQNIHSTHDVFANAPLQAFVTSQAGHHASRENVQSPKK